MEIFKGSYRKILEIQNTSESTAIQNIINSRDNIDLLLNSIQSNIIIEHFTTELKLVINNSVSPMALQHVLYNIYDDSLINTINENIEQTDNILILGSNIGLAAIACQLKAKKDINIIEPFQQNIELTNLSFKENYLHANILHGICFPNPEKANIKITISKLLKTSKEAVTQEDTREFLCPVINLNTILGHGEYNTLIINMPNFEEKIITEADLSKVNKIIVNSENISAINKVLKLLKEQKFFATYTNKHCYTLERVK